MKIGFIGLGKMGLNMVTRLVQHNHEVVAYAPHAESVDAAKAKGALGANSIEELVANLERPRVIWVMVPAGEPTENTLVKLGQLLDEEDIIIDGGNSYYRDSMRRSEELKAHNIQFVDVGTSGGIWGLKNGYCLMAGGSKDVYDFIEPLLRDLAPENGYDYIGPHGSGHFVKMVHNGIEYAMLQAYGEGFEIIEAKKEFDVDLGKLAGLWQHGGVIRSWLLELAQDALNEDPKLDSVLGYVEDSGEGRWTLAEAIAEDIPAPTIAASIFERFHSRQVESFSAKLTAALRKKFGGHTLKQRGKE